MEQEIIEKKDKLKSCLNFLVKTVLFIVYHTLLLTIVYFISIYLLEPMVDFQWHWFVDWFRKTLIAVYYAGGFALTVMSILSCWDSSIKEDQIGQISIGGWLAWFGVSQKNTPLLGVFTGLPAVFVKIQSFSAKAPKIVRASSIQIPIHDDPNGKLFQAEFLWTGKVNIENTMKYILNPIREAEDLFKVGLGSIDMSKVNKDWDIVNVVERILTKWSNDKDREFNNLNDVKIIKKDIEEMLILEASKDLMKSHGIKLSEFFLESIEIPKVQIERQIEDAKARAATVEAEEREQLDNKSLIKQAKALQKASKDADGNVTLGFEKALQLAQIQQGKVRATAATISSSGKGKKGPVILDGDG